MDTASHSQLSGIVQSASLQPERIESLLAQAEAYADREHWLDARHVYEDVLRLEPQNPTARNGLGIVLEELNDAAGAERHYRAAIAARPDYLSAYNNLAAMYEEQKHVRRAMRVYAASLPYVEDPAKRAALQAKVGPWLEQRKTVVQCHNRAMRWAASSVVGGLFSLVLNSEFDAVWGTEMVLIGVLLWRVHSPIMLLTLTVALGWAATNNLLGGWWSINASRWLFVGAVQFVWAIVLLQQYHAYASLPLRDLFSKNDWPQGVLPPEETVKAGGRLAVVGASLSALSLLMLPGVLAGAIVASLMGMADLSWFDRALDAIPDVSVLAIGLCVAGVASSKARRAWAIAGVATGSATILLWIALLLL